jgi:hypothetical protein
MHRLTGAPLLCAALVLACGDGLVTPDREVASLALARDSATIEVGDAALVRAEPRDAQGNPLFDVRVAWRPLDAALASVTVNGPFVSVTALAPGITGVEAKAGTVADTVTVSIPPPITATTLSVHLDTLETLGDSLVVEAISQSDAGPRLGRYTAVTRDHTVAVVLDDPHPLTIVAVDPGATWIVVTEQRGTRDSLRVVVRQRPASVAFPSTPIAGYLGRTAQLSAVVRDGRGNPITGAEVMYGSTDAKVATVTQAGVVGFVGVGTGAVIATSPEGPADTAAVTTLGPPPLSLAGGAIHTGTGLLSEPRWIENPYDAVDPWVRLTLTDTSVADVPDSVRYVGEAGTFRVIGRRAGTALLIASATLMTPDTVPVTVSTARVSLVDWTFPAADPRDLPSGVKADLAIRLQDSLGTFRDAADSVTAVLASSDTTVVSLPYTAYAVRPLDQGIPLFPAVAGDTGLATVVATAPGFLPDTVRYRVTPLPGLLFQSGGLQTIGAGQMRSTESPSVITTTAGFERVDTEVPITFARRNAGVASFPAAVTIPVNATGAAVPYVGLTPGTDTILATAPGYAPDTLVLVVTTPHFALPDTVTGTIASAWTVIHIADSLGTIHATTDEVTVTATPADPTVALPSSTTIPSQWSWLWSLPFLTVDTGSTSVSVEAGADGYAPAAITLAVVLDTTLRLTGPGAGATTLLAPRQRYPTGAFGVQGPEGHLVRLGTTEPGVLRVTDSVTLGGGTPITVAAGDVTGTTRIVATAHGFVPDTSGTLAVAPGKLVLEAPAYGLVGGTGYTVSVTALSPEEFAFPLDTAATFTLVPLDGGLDVSADARIDAGESTTGPLPLALSTAGTFRLAVEDRRPVPVPYAGDTVTITASAPRLRLGTYPYPVIGVGQRLLGRIDRPYPLTPGSVTVSITRRTQRTASAATRTIPAGVESVEYTIDGRSAGPDTLILSAPDHLPDTVAIWVSDGTVTLRDFPSSIRLGDSVGVILEVRDSAGGAHAVVDATTFAIFGQGGLAFSDGQRAISTVTVPAGLGVTPRFWLKAVGPAGSAGVRFYHLNYVDRLFATSVVTSAATSPP